jgi:glycerol kinase
MQFVADMTGLELRVSEIAESSAWGAAMSGLLALGNHKSLDSLPVNPQPARSYRPQMNAEKVAQLYSDWLAAVKRVL